MRDAVICEPVRTPVGRFGGALRPLQAYLLAVQVMRRLYDRTGLPPVSVDDVLLGHCYPTSDASAFGRVVAHDDGLPISVPGMQLDRRCGSGLQAVIDASMRIQTGAADLI